MKYRSNPAGGQAAIRAIVGDKRAGGSKESGLAGEGEPLARLINHANTGITERDLLCIVSAGVVDDDDLDQAAARVGKAARLVKYGFETARKIALLVVG